MMKNRKLIYLFALLFTAAFAVSGMAQTPPFPENPTTYTTTYEAETTVGEPVTVEAYLENDDGNALPDYEITFILGESLDEDGNIVGEIARKYGTTNSEGIAEVTFDGETVPDAGGEYVYKAYFGGSTDPDYDSSQDTAPVTVNKITTVLEVRIKPAPKADTINHPACGYCDRQPLDKSSRFRLDGQSYTFIHTPYRIRGWF